MFENPSWIMAMGKLILICRSGGKFVTDHEGNKLYNGGEATTENLTYETPFEGLKLKLAKMYNLDHKKLTIKYFLPGNKRNLITMKNDKDVKRMIEFHGDTLTAEVFVDGDQIGESCIPKDEMVDHDNLRSKKAENVNHGNLHSKKPDEKHESSEIDADVSSPAYTVKKRRRNNNNNSFGSKSRGKNGRLASTKDKKRDQIVIPIIENDQELDFFHGKEEEEEPYIQPYPLAICDDDISPETLADCWKSAITGVGQEFENVHDFRESLQKYALVNRFVYRLTKFDSRCATGRCAAEECSWKFYAAWVPTIESFKIMTFNYVHSCNQESKKSVHPMENWLVNTINERLQCFPNLKPKEIANAILRESRVELNDARIRQRIGDSRNREALPKSPKDSYNKLPWFCEKIVEKNPGSIAELVINESKIFKSLFVSFSASLSGFSNHCRPLLFLESTSLKSEYGEVLFTANSIDGNDGIFPVAFAVVDIENDTNWRWFIEQLKSAISNSKPITFVSDREKNLKNLVLEIFLDAHIGFSIYHLLETLKTFIKPPFHSDGTTHFLVAARAVRLAGFRKSIDWIKRISPPAYEWITQIEPENWTVLPFKGERYHHITENFISLYANLMAAHRKSPILNKLDTIICMMIDNISEAKYNASIWSTHLTALKEKQLEQESRRAGGLKVLIASDTLFEVRADSTHVVNTSSWSCSCLGWKETGLPCRHALAVFTLTGKNPYDFCSIYFTVDAYRRIYSGPIHPFPISQNTEKHEGFEVDEGECSNVDGENGGGESEKSGKVEGGKGNVGEEDEDPNVLVLPPIPACKTL